MVLQELTNIPRVEKSLWYRAILAASEGTEPRREVISCPPKANLPTVVLGPRRLGPGLKGWLPTGTFLQGRKEPCRPLRG